MEAEANTDTDVPKPPESLDAEELIQTPASTSTTKKVDVIDSITPRKLSHITGYRMMDMELLSEVFGTLCCPSCFFDSLTLVENHAKKQGICSALSIKCSRCNFQKDFLSSKKSGKGYDINRRSVYGFRALGNGHAGIQKFMSLMDMPRPMAQSTYDKIVTSMTAVSKSIAEESMKEAVKEARNEVGAFGNEIGNIGISVDGAWQRRGYSSLNCVVTAISLHNGKIIDIEPISRSCKACNLKEHLKETDPVDFANWQ